LTLGGEVYYFSVYKMGPPLHLFGTT